VKEQRETAAGGGARTIAAVYTGRGLDEQVAAAARDILPGVRLTSIIDDSIIFDINSGGGLTPETVRRMLRYYANAADSGASVILNTCSSVGEVVALGQPTVPVPIIRIDEPMAAEAVARFDRVGVLATLPSTLHPTRRLLTEKAAAGNRAVRITAVVAEGAYAALAAGDGATHDRLVTEAVGRLGREVDGIVLAQASMARIANRLTESARVPVLTSLRSGLAAARAELDRLGGPTREKDAS